MRTRLPGLRLSFVGALAVSSSLPTSGHAAPDEIFLEEAMLDHEPVLEHRAGRPIGIVVRSNDEAITRCILRYRGEGRWHKTRMQRDGNTFRATIPCGTVESEEAVEYFIEAHDATGELLESTGSSDTPLLTRLTSTGPLSLADERCEREPPRVDPAARGDSTDCGGRPCDDASPSGVWLDFSVMQDIHFGGGTRTCAPDTQQAGQFACFRGGGSQYIGTPAAGRDGSLASTRFATTRLLAGLSTVALGVVTLGARLGYAFGGGPPPAGGHEFLPLHAEAEATYWFSQHAYEPSGFAPYLLVAGGLGQIDSSAKTTITEQPGATPPPSQIDNPPNQTLEVWKKSGVAFASAGLGAFLSGNARRGVFVELRGTTLFPSSGAAASMRLGYTFGL